VTVRRAGVAAAILVIALAGAWVLFIGLPRWYGQGTPSTAAPGPGTTTAGPERRIKATLYFVSEDGMSLVGVEREVPFAEAVVDQARRIVEAEIADPPAPLAAPVPAGTALRSLFVTDRGDAFVDLNRDVSTKHTGGSLDELFTVYAIVDSLTVNLPAITRVQILIDGKEADTIAGHVDIRHPLQKNLKWVKTSKEGT
jgi:hypothetical protein